MSDTEQLRKELLAQDVLRLSHNTLLVNLRFLDVALSRLQYEPCGQSTLMTDDNQTGFAER